MQLSLNGFQVITDGFTYRRDQVPARPLAECLAACPDYPVNRAGFAGPFLDPATVPEGEAFTAWYREHVKRFFGVTGPDYDALFSLHELEHKACGDGGPVPFDGLCCDGSANYVKLVRGVGGWAVAGGTKDGFKARSFREGAKAALAPWVLGVYAADRYPGPPPIVASPGLLTYKAAGGAARTALKDLDRLRPRREGQPQAAVYYPLGLERVRVQSYKVLKPSGFLFRTPRQQAAWTRAMAKFAAATSCGLELLALRRGGRGRRKGSIADLADAVYRLIQNGETNPTKALNLTRRFKELEDVETGHHAEVLARKAAAGLELSRQIDAAAMDDAAKLTGLFVRHEDLFRLG